MRRSKSCFLASADRRCYSGNREDVIMWKSVDAVIEKDGKVRLKEPVRLKTRCRAIVTIIDETLASEAVPEASLLSEPVLSKDWNRPEEDEAWSHLEKAR